MATLQELQETLVKAHNAGDVESARALTRAIDQMATPPVEPTQQVVEQVEEVQEPEGLGGKIKEAFTGEFRTTPELEALKDISDLPELNEITVAGLKSAFSTLTADPMEAAQALKVNFPEIEIRQDAKGNPIVKSAISGEEFAVNKPGLDLRDIGRGAFITSLFASPLGRRALGRGGVGRAVATGAGTQAAIETAQQATGGEFDPEQVALAGVTETIGPAARALTGAGRQAVGTVQRVAGRTPTPLTPAQQAVAQAEDVGIPVLTSDVRAPQTFFGKFAQAVQERTPLVGTGAARAGQKEARREAVTQALREQGAEELLPASDTVMQDLIKTRGGKISKYARMKNEVIDRLDDEGSIVPVSDTVELIDDEISKLEKLNTSGVNSLVSLLKDFKGAISVSEEFKNTLKGVAEQSPGVFKVNLQQEIDRPGQTLKNIELLRKQLGEQLTDPNLASIRSLGEKTARKIYRSLNEDMASFIGEKGQRRDLAKWKIANRQLANAQSELGAQTLKSALQKGDITPEVVRKMLFSKNPSDIRLLYKNLSPTGKKRAKVAIAQEIFQKAGGQENITPAKFINKLKQFENSTDVFFNKTEKQQFKGLVKALQLTRQADVADFKPVTGAEGTIVAVPALLGGIFGGPGGILATLGVGGLARLYETKPFRNLLLQLAADKKIPPAKEREIINKLVSVVQTARQISEPKEED